MLCQRIFGAHHIVSFLLPPQYTSTLNHNCVNFGITIYLQWVSLTLIRYEIVLTYCISHSSENLKRFFAPTSTHHNAQLYKMYLKSIAKWHKYFWQWIKCLFHVRYCLQKLWKCVWYIFYVIKIHGFIHNFILTILKFISISMNITRVAQFVIKTS